MSNRLGTALVTGAAGGIGSATARRLAADGYRVVVSDIDEAGGHKVVASIEDAGGEARFQRLDVTSECDWQEQLARIAAGYGPLRVLVNNAGTGDLATIEDTDLASYERTIAITQTGMFLGMKYGGAALLAADGGSIVNISSVFGASGGFGTSPAYHAAKGAVRILTKNVAVLWATRGIRVNSIHPGFIATEGILASRGTPVEDAMLSMTPMGRLGLPEEVAAAVSFLAGDQSTFITGSELYVDGGYTAR
jgi:NAD(P)-dependent dehydrogenase (short-subunit alcohol dehydrogenase family)